MNENQRQLILLIGFMTLLAVVFIFVNFAGIERPSIGDGAGDKQQTKQPQDSSNPETGGPLGQSLSGLYSLYNATTNGWQNLGQLAQD